MKLCLAIPYYGAADARFNRCVQNVMTHPPCAMAMVDIIGDSLIPRARNTLTYKFLNTDADAMLFIDSDILFTPAHVARILSHDLEKTPCIGGVYPKKQVAPGWVLNTFEEGPNEPEADGLLRVKYAGTGFMIITRKALEEIAARWPDRKYAADTDEEGDERYDYFPIGPRNYILPDSQDLEPGKERYLSEDWAFCEMVRALGYDVQADTEIKLEHLGVVPYPIRAEQVLSREAVRDLHIGSTAAAYLKNVEVFGSNANPDTGQPERRLIDVDQFVKAISPSGE